MSKKIKKELVEKLSESSKIEFVESVNELKFDFTGKMVVVLELDPYGPMEFRVDDKDVCTKIIRLLLKEMGPSFPVDAYNKKTENTLRKIMDF